MEMGACVNAAKKDATGSIVKLRPTAGAIAGTLVASLVFIILLDFLVFISFIGQRLWDDPRLFNDHFFTLPLYIWFVIVGLVVVATLRIITQRLIIDSTAVRVRGLFRLPKRVEFKDMSGVWVVRDFYRGKSPRNPVEKETDAAEAVIIMERDEGRVANVSSRFFRGAAQSAVIEAAEQHDVPVTRLDNAKPAELVDRAFGSLTFIDRHPNLIIAGVVLVYLAHNVLTFVVWGL